MTESSNNLQSFRISLILLGENHLLAEASAIASSSDNTIKSGTRNYWQLSCKISNILSFSQYVRDFIESEPRGKVLR